MGDCLQVSKTTLEGVTVNSFQVGGELRLPLAQVLNHVLDKYSLPAIREASSELQIPFSTCSVDQLQILQDIEAIPKFAYSAQLISKTDAERLCDYLYNKVMNAANVTFRVTDTNNPWFGPKDITVPHGVTTKYILDIAAKEFNVHPTNRILITENREIINCEDTARNILHRHGARLRLIPSVSVEEKVVPRISLKYSPVKRNKL